MVDDCTCCIVIHDKPINLDRKSSRGLEMKVTCLFFKSFNKLRSLSFFLMQFFGHIIIMLLSKKEKLTNIFLVPLQPGLNRLVLSIEVVHVRNQILDHIHVRQRINLGHFTVNIDFTENKNKKVE